VIAFRKCLFVTVSLSFGFGFLAGCRHASDAHPARGVARFQILTPRGQASNQAVVVLDEGQPREVITDAELMPPSPMPVYPPAALRSRHNGAVVAVHIVVDPIGEVRAVSPSLKGFSTAGPFTKEFQAAVEAAVRQWKFRPAEAQTIESLRHADGRVERKIVRREPVEARFDLAFTFTSTGDVLPAR
jgi:TonB family protein